jgi:hypothetical protein
VEACPVKDQVRLGRLSAALVRRDFRCRLVDSVARRSSYCATIWEQRGSNEEEAMKYVMLIYQGSALER